MNGVCERGAFFGDAAESGAAEIGASESGAAEVSFFSHKWEKKLFVCCLKPRALAGALDLWSANASEAARVGGICRKVVLRMKGRFLASALETWLDNVRKLARVAVCSRKILLRMSNKALAVTLWTWAVNVSNANRLAGVCKKVVMRMRSRVISAALSAWSENVHELAQASAWTRATALAAEVHKAPIHPFVFLGHPCLTATPFACACVNSSGFCLVNGKSWGVGL